MNDTKNVEFVPFRKIPRLNRECVITEKIDGTNGIIHITEEGDMLVGSRTRWIYPGKQDNYGFAAWAEANRPELLRLGPGTHYGEWWGAGIQRRYNQTEKRFSLFNVHKWQDDDIRPLCCSVVPVVFRGLFTTEQAAYSLEFLRSQGSLAAPGFMNPEGIVVFHTAGSILFKATLENDEKGKPE